MRTERRRVSVLRILGGIIAAMIFATVLGVVIPRPLWRDASLGPPTRTILVIANPIHTDIAFAPDPDVLSAFGFLAEDGLPLAHPDLRWIAVGWGGRAFYTETPEWSELKAIPVLRGLTYDASVMHVMLYGAFDTDAPDVLPIALSEADFQRVVATIRQSFRDDAAGQPDIIEGVHYGASDLFYEANGGFTALMGCNTWTAAMLRQGGLQTGWWTPLPQSLMLSLKLYNKLPR